MEQFIKNIVSIWDGISAVNTYTIINNITIDKQYLIYYMYRIICAYIKAFKNTDKMFKIFGLSADKGQFQPLANHITRDISQLDAIYTLLLDIMKSDVDISHVKLMQFIELRSGDKAIIIRDIQELHKLIPNLSS
jgi:hypothetical protein